MHPLQPAYSYRATIDRWVDADTVDMLVDAGFRCFMYLRIRLARINAPERGTPEHPASFDYIATRAPVGTEVHITTKRCDPYGRWIGEVVMPDMGNLSDEMLAKGFAKAYTGG